MRSGKRQIFKPYEYSRMVSAHLAARDAEHLPVTQGDISEATGLAQPAVSVALAHGIAWGVVRELPRQGRAKRYDLVQ